MAGYPITLTVSPGRSGTVFLHATFSQNFPANRSITHELIHAMVGQPAAFHRAYDQQTKQQILSMPILQDLLGRWRAAAQSGPVVDFGWTMSSLVPAFYDTLGEQFRVLVLHRHPVSAAASFATMGFNKTLKHERYALTPMHARVRFAHYADRWGRMSTFEKCLFRWMEVTAYGIELEALLPGHQYKIVSFDELVRSDGVLESIGRLLGFSREAPLVRAVETNSLDHRSREMYPIGKEWRNYKRFPELLELARTLGYDMDEAHVEHLVKKYQRPPGVLPFLRSTSGYWKWKSRAGNLLESVGLRRKNDGKLKLRRQLDGTI
jgi:hypothetical protein